VEIAHNPKKLLQDRQENMQSVSKNVDTIAQNLKRFFYNFYKRAHNLKNFYKMPYTALKDGEEHQNGDCLFSNGLK
jgi:hypothetical protein